LRNYGYRVIDLGKDVSAEDIIETTKKEMPDIIGLSALMTTTMVNMKDAITLARANGIQNLLWLAELCLPKIMRKPLVHISPKTELPP